MNRLLTRPVLIHRQVIHRRELSIGTKLSWRGDNDKKQYGQTVTSWSRLSNNI